MLLYVTPPQGGPPPVMNGSHVDKWPLPLMGAFYSLINVYIDQRDASFVHLSIPSMNMGYPQLGCKVYNIIPTPSKYSGCIAPVERS